MSLQNILHHFKKKIEYFRKRISIRKEYTMVLLSILFSVICLSSLSYGIILPFPPDLPPHLRPTSAPTNSPTSQVVSFSEHGLSTVKSSNAVFSEFGQAVKSSNNFVGILAHDDSTDRNSILVYHIDDALESNSSSSSSSLNSNSTVTSSSNSNSNSDSVTYTMRSVINLESNPSEFDNFGNSFAMNNNSMVIGASMDSEELQSAGAVYYISFAESDDGDAILSTKIYSPAMMKKGMFGTNVALSTMAIAVTAQENSSVVHFYQTDNVYASMVHINSISWEDICEYISIYVDIDECSSDDDTSSRSMSTESFRDLVNMNDDLFIASYENGHIVSFKYADISLSSHNDRDDEIVDDGDDEAGSEGSSSFEYASDIANSTALTSSNSTMTNAASPSNTSTSDTSSSSSSSRKLTTTARQWTVDAILMAPNMTGSTSLSGFGNTMAASSGFLFVSSTTCIDQQGCVFVYHHVSINGTSKASLTESWSLLNMLYASNGYPYDNFGTSIALSSDGTQALIGAPSTNRSDVLTKSGTTYMFEIKTSGVWVQTAILVSHNLSSDASSNGEYDGCGASVAFANDNDGAFVGAAFTNEAEGAVYYFGNLDSYRIKTGTSSTSKGSAYSSHESNAYRKSSAIDLTLLLGVAIPATVAVLMYLMWDEHKTRAVKHAWYKVQNCFGHRYGKLEEDSISLMRSRSRSDCLTLRRIEEIEEEEEGIITLSLGNEHP